jgi:hypothetical protein
MRYRIAAAVVVTLGLTACAKPIVSDIRAYSAAPASAYAGKRIVILPGDQAKIGSLEFAQFSGDVAAQLRAKGAIVVPPDQAANADYIAVLAYGADNGRTETHTGAIPQYGVTGYGGATTYGTINTFGPTSTYRGTTTLTPRFCVTGFLPYQTS